MTLSEAHSLYKKRFPEHKIGLTSFKQLKPKQVKIVSETGRRTCLCRPCCNVALKVEAIKKLGTKPDGEILKDISKQKLVDVTMCSYSKDETPHAKCLRRECSKCGPSLNRSSYNTALTALEDEEVEWRKWDYVNMMKKGKSRRIVSCVAKKTTLKELIGDLETDLITFPEHIFRATWQCRQLSELTKI